jgi:hypothetical protein
MKKIYILFFTILLYSTAKSQISGDPALFDIRGNIYSDAPTAGVHDWFIGST